MPCFIFLLLKTVLGNITIENNFIWISSDFIWRQLRTKNNCEQLRTLRTFKTFKTFFRNVATLCCNTKSCSILIAVPIFNIMHEKFHDLLIYSVIYVDLTSVLCNRFFRHVIFINSEFLFI